MEKNLAIVSLGVSDVENLQDFVVRVTWAIQAQTNRCDETGNPYCICESGKTILDYTNTNGEFVSFNQLTEQKVKEWVEASDEYAIANKILDQRLLKENAPSTMLKPLPWQQQS